MTYYQSSHGHNNSVINGIGRIGYMTGGKAALWDDTTMSDVFTREALAFIEDSREDPFFLFFASHENHVPRVPHPRFVGVSDRGRVNDRWDQGGGEERETNGDEDAKADDAGHAQERKHE